MWQSVAAIFGKIDFEFFWYAGIIGVLIYRYWS